MEAGRVLRNGAGESLLDTYEAERRPIATEMITLAIGYLKAMKEGNRQRGRDVQQLDLGYPESSLSLHHPSREGKIGARNRAPDAPCKHKGGESTTLFHIYRGPHWTLLSCGDASIKVEGKGLRSYHVSLGEEDPAADLVDDAGHILSAYHLKDDEFILIRPDGHIATILPAGEAETLKAQLHTWNVLVV